MIDIFVKAWDENNKKLLESFISKRPSDYLEILKRLVTEVINPCLEKYGIRELDISKITVIDDGDYQGTIIYIIPFNTYEPLISDYVMTHNNYGSCSGCDTFLYIEENYNLDYKPTKEKIEQAAKEFHTLALHLLQRFTRFESEVK